MTDKPLTARLITIEMAVAIMAIVITSSGVWFGLTAKVEASDVSIKSIKIEQTAQGEDIQKIKTDIAVIRERQLHAAKVAEEQKAQTQRILDIVQQPLINRRN
jgi:hypothetical protein